MKRLHPSALDRLPGDVRRPCYPRDALRAGIVHLGVGAFVRAHLAAATEAAIHADGDLRWGIAGVSLEAGPTRATRSRRSRGSTRCRCATRTPTGCR